VAISHPLHSTNVIETALRGAPPAANKLAGQEQAMAKRLAQLQTALGNEPAAPETSKAPAVKASRSPFRLTQIILISLCTAMLGAGTMRLALATNPTPAERPAAITLSSPSSATPETANPATLSHLREADQERIETLLESWRQAWQAHDVAGYLGHYGTAFTPVDGSSRDTWAAARTQKLSSKAAIAVQIKEIDMARINADLYKVSFVQSYASGSYREAGRNKTLHLAREQGDWKIIREQQD
jgi:ketosteroid isomerase-like protein